MLRDAFVSGANQVTNEMEAINALNIFPVPDGDTGTNMSKTLQNAKSELIRISDSLGVGEVAKIAASAMLRGARGNSGVITSQIFRGFSQGLENKEEVENYILETQKKSNMDRTELNKGKTGCIVKGIEAINFEAENEDYTTDIYNIELDKKLINLDIQ